MLATVFSGLNWSCITNLKTEKRVKCPLFWYNDLIIDASHIIIIYFNTMNYMILYLYAYSNFFMPIIAVFGLLVGSFLNCVVYRLETRQSFLKGRSFCPYCKKTLQWYDLIPVLSFLWLRGKCRYCKTQISWQYPLVEIATALLFLLLFIFRYNFLFYILIVPALIIIFVYDLKHYIIPDKVIYPAIAVSGIWYLVSGIFFASYTKYNIQNTIYSAFGAALFFLLIVLITRGKGMGIGDIKLAFLMGLILGWPDILVALLLAFFLGAAIGLVLIILGKKSMKSEVPFGPFLITGLLLVLFFGDKLIDWYLSVFLLR